MARGAVSKDILTKKILQIYPEAFMDGKIIRVPFNENGETIEIKVSLTAAKDVIGGGSSTVAPTASAPTYDPNVPWDEVMNPPENNSDWKMTPEEEAATADIMAKLGL